VKILKKWERKLNSGWFKPRCRGLSFEWFSETDRGQSHAINKGMRLSTGEVLAYLNSDDVYERGAFEAVTKEIKKVDFLYSPCVFVNEKGEVIKSYKAKSRPFDFEQLLNEKNYILQPTTFWKREVFAKVGEFNEKLHYVMDYEYWIRVYEAGFKFKFLKKQPLARFRIHSNAKSVRRDDLSFAEKRMVARAHGGKFYSLMYYLHLRDKALKILEGVGLPGEEILDRVTRLRARIAI
jgi:glycosyltransferase involved in cell wall biosynthesis